MGIIRTVDGLKTSVKETKEEITHMMENPQLSSEYAFIEVTERLIGFSGNGDSSQQFKDVCIMSQSIVMWTD